MRPVIRPARTADLSAVRRIAYAAYALYVPRIGRKPVPIVADFAAAHAAGALRVAADGAVGAVLGFVVAYPRGDHWHLENVAVDPIAQGTGLRRRLITHVEALARADGARAIELYTNARMTKNQRLYPRLGYAQTDRAVEDGFDWIYYRKELD